MEDFMTYNYYDAMCTDIEDYLTLNGIKLSNYESYDEAYNELYDDLFEASEVTGNGPNSFYSNKFACEEYLCHNFDLAREACRDFCVDGDTILNHLEKGTLIQYLDCTIRCYIVGEVLSDILNTYFSDNESGEIKNEP